jgi:alpha-glucosidase (family GH31 glycosyl hydrolase)
MLGHDVLLAPILRPGQVSRAVYLPPGRWLDLRHGTIHEPGAALARASLDDDMPIYLRSGAILPTGPVLRWTSERPTDPLTLHVFPDETGRAEGRLYEDDGESTDHRFGASSRTIFRAESGDDAIVLSARRDVGAGYEPPPRRVEIVLHSPAGRVTKALEDVAEWRVTLPWPDARG